MKPQQNFRKAACPCYTKSEKRKKAMRALARKILSGEFIGYYDTKGDWSEADARKLARMVLR